MELISLFDIPSGTQNVIPVQHNNKHYVLKTMLGIEKIMLFAVKELIIE